MLVAQKILIGACGYMQLHTQFTCVRMAVIYMYISTAGLLPVVRTVFIVLQVEYLYALVYQTLDLIASKR